MIESWPRRYNTENPHGSLGYKPPAQEAFVPAFAARATAQPQPAPPPVLVPRQRRSRRGALKIARRISTTAGF